MSSLTTVFPPAFIAAITLLIASLGGDIPLSEATPQIPQQIRFDPPTPPDPGEPSDRGQGGGHRGACEERYQSLTALVPAIRPDTLWGLTVRDRPTVWFSLPAQINTEAPAQWRLQDAKGKLIYKTTLRIPKTTSTSQIISLSMPTTAPPLTQGTYRWELAIFCDEAIDTPVVRRGTLQRITASPKLRQELAIAKTPLDRATSYAKSGIWYDALSELGTQLRISKTNPTIAAWNQLLQQQNLTAPPTLTPCCAPK